MAAAAAAVVLTLFNILTAISSQVEGQRWPRLVPSYSDSCGGNYEAEKGTISSPNFPGVYPDNVECVWTLTSPPNTTIMVTFETFHTQDRYDYLEFRDGADSSAPYIKTCSGTVCSDVTSATNLLYLKFHTEGSYTYIGFKLIWFSVGCYSCDTIPGSNQYDPACGENACFTNVHYDGSHRVERGGTENPELEGRCFDTGYSISCYCLHNQCNNNLCQNCEATTHQPIISTSSHTAPTSYTAPTTTLPSIITATNPTSTFTTSPGPSSQLPTFSTSPAPESPLGCFSCFGCNTVNGDTHVEASEDFLSCFTAIQLGDTNFVIRGGSPDLYEDGSCRHEDGAFICYCSSNRCNSETAVQLMENL